MHGTGCEQEPGTEEAEAQDSVTIGGMIGELGATRLALVSRVPFIFTCVLLDSQEGDGRLGAYDSINHSGIGFCRPFLPWSFGLLVGSM